MDQLARLLRKCNCGHPEGVHDLHSPFRCFACTCTQFSPGPGDELLTTLMRIADALDVLVAHAPPLVGDPLLLTADETKVIRDLRSIIGHASASASHEPDAPSSSEVPTENVVIGDAPSSSAPPPKTRKKKGSRRGR